MDCSSESPNKTRVMTQGDRWGVYDIRDTNRKSDVQLSANCWNPNRHVSGVTNIRGSSIDYAAALNHFRESHPSFVAVAAMIAHADSGHAGMEVLLGALILSCWAPPFEQHIARLVGESTAIVNDNVL